MALIGTFWYYKSGRHFWDFLSLLAEAKNGLALTHVKIEYEVVSFCLVHILFKKW